METLQPYASFACYAILPDPVSEPELTMLQIYCLLVIFL